MTVFPFEAGEIPTASKFGEGPAAYTPALTADTVNPNLGATGEAIGAWVRSGPQNIDGWARFLFSGASLDPGSGFYFVSLPVAADLTLLEASPTAAAGSQIGTGRIRDESNTAASTIVSVQLQTATTVNIVPASGVSRITNNSPWIWAEGDRISIFFNYISQEGA